MEIPAISIAIDFTSFSFFKRNSGVLFEKRKLVSSNEDGGVLPRVAATIPDKGGVVKVFKRHSKYT